MWRREGGERKGKPRGALEGEWTHGRLKKDVHITVKSSDTYLAVDTVFFCSAMPASVLTSCCLVESLKPVLAARHPLAAPRYLYSYMPTVLCLQTSHPSFPWPHSFRGLPSSFTWSHCTFFCAAARLLVIRLPSGTSTSSLPASCVPSIALDLPVSGGRRLRAKAARSTTCAHCSENTFTRKTRSKSGVIYLQMCWVWLVRRHTRFRPCI